MTPSGPSNSFTINPAAAAQLKIQTPPYTSVIAGNPLTDPIEIYVEDRFGHRETSDNTTQVSVSLASGGGMLTGGPTTVTVQAGVASFDNLEDDTAGDLTLQFT